MKAEDVKIVAVLGAGTMGHGIVQVMAMGGYKVIMRTRKQETLDSGLRRIKESLQKFTERGKISQEESNEALSRISTTLDLKEAVKDTDLCIETIVENMEIKKSFFKEIEAIAKEDAVFASNTSTLSITEIASLTNRPQRVVGMHFSNPVPLMQPVEIIRGVLTSEEAIEVTRGVTLKIGKTPIVVKDSPGFASTRLGVALYLEACRMLEEGVASVRDIDTGAKLFYGHRMGPFETCDLVGLDARLNNVKAMYEATGDPRWKPPLLLKQLVTAGYLGKKPGSKGGYYAYFGPEE
jgi:3-hydroxybutyryl-CoA dehydrogenase